MPTQQELIEQHKRNQQMAAYKKAKADMQRRQIPSYINTVSNGMYKGGQRLSDLGTTLSGSQNPTVQSIGDKMQSFGGHMQTASGQPLYNDLKSKAGQMIADKLGLSASNTAPTALTGSISQAAPSATSSLPSTIGAAEGAGALGTAAGGTAGTAAGTGSAIGSAIGANVAGTAGTTAGTSAIGSAIGAAAPAATSAAGAGAAGAGAATAGAGAAAGGAGAAALGALGPIGAGIAVASLIYNMFQSAQKKKQQASMQKDMENVQRTQQADAQKKSEVINELDQNINGNIQGLAENAQPTDTKQNLINSLMSNFRGEPTGAASNINNVVTPEGVQQQAPILPNIQIPMPDNRTLKQKMFDGVKDIYAGYKDNSTNDFMHGDLMNQLSSPDEVQPGEENGMITGGAAKVQPKSGWQRVGEAVGTGQRLLSNPIVQGLIAGTLYGKDKGDALYGVGKGVEWAQNKAKSNYYADELGQPRTILSNYDSKDYNARTLSSYRDTMANNAKLKTEAQLDKTNPKMIDFANARLASGEWTPDEYNTFINAPNFMADNRMSLETIKTMSDKKSKEAKASTDAIKANTDKVYKGKLGNAAVTNASANDKRANVAMVNAQNKQPKQQPIDQTQVNSMYDNLKNAGYSHDQIMQYFERKGIK